MREYNNIAKWQDGEFNYRGTCHWKQPSKKQETSAEMLYIGYGAILADFQPFSLTIQKRIYAACSAPWERLE